MVSMRELQAHATPSLLPGDRRDIVYFRDERSMTFEQIAKRLGVSASEVRVVYREEAKK
jgi:DNA-directed RNA polymerase specialized sigma24 family protein